MSTNATIIVKLPKNKKFITFSPTLLASPIMIPCFGETKLESKKASIIKHKIANTATYASIYHHWDGYLDSLGNELFHNYNTIEKAINLITLGNCSSIIGGKISPYCYRASIDKPYFQPQKWSENKPILFNDLKDAEPQQFMYLFDGKVWKYSKNFGKRWYLLTEKNTK